MYRTYHAYDVLFESEIPWRALFLANSKKFKKKLKNIDSMIAMEEASHPVPIVMKN